MPCVYFVQPSTLRNTSRFKIGRSSKDDLSRVRSYGNGTRYLCVMDCIDDIYVEKLLINHFNKKFKLIAGNEYFEGCENEMLNEFIDVVMKYKNKAKENKKIKKYIEERPEMEEISDVIKTEKILIEWNKFKFNKNN